ncbi:MAG: pentapeptide repeat-containing protein [Leptonema sp. (in: bacteria)]
MDFEKFKQINDQRLNYGEIENADIVSLYKNSGCGDGYRIFIKLENQDDKKIIQDASFTTTGCSFSFVALALGIELIKNKELIEAKAITANDIEKLFEFPERRKNYPQSAAEAIQKAISNYLEGKKEEYVSKNAILKKLKEQGHLRNENLKQVVLDNEDLRGVDLSGANLQNAFLQNANLEGANLKNANLRGAYLNNTNLRNANFENADLRFAKLTGAQIEGANFKDALYDIGTRIEPKYLSIFSQMKKK